MNDPREALMAATTETLERAAFAPTVDPTPFLKWVGGKTRLLSQMEGLLPEEFDGYHEPFVGGGAVFFRLLPDQARLTDVNGRLIDCYTAIRDDVESLADEHGKAGQKYTNGAGEVVMHDSSPSWLVEGGQSRMNRLPSRKPKQALTHPLQFLWQNEANRKYQENNPRTIQAASPATTLRRGRGA